ncbi:MAG TPA: dTDP-4-amino-4,6-dideoxygalactose transaminase [Cyclobacteriaceae bacterium]|nr:dTDP-4-amino-4,6-dideoxygalactose transaminase [Cyclobacteriaceae bacterium]
MIALNKAYLTGKENQYIGEALKSQTSGNGVFTKKSHQFFCDKYNFKKTLLTTSCTAALEMTAILIDIKPGDEVIIPSFTFVSTANAFVLRGAKIVFADSLEDHPNIDVSKLESLITPRTTAIIVVHYAGVAVDMDQLMDLAKRYNLFVVEDAAQAIDSYYKGRPLGGIGHLGCFSFHDTKNIVSGEGGLLVVNDERFIQRAEIIWEKGTNRSAFIRGEVDKYGWVDVGSSYLPSEIIAAFLYAQLENLEHIQKLRIEKWNYYFENLRSIDPAFNVALPHIPDFARHNGHIFYLVCDNVFQRDYLSKTLRKGGVQAYFHYPALHLSQYYLRTHQPRILPNALGFSEKLVRLPLYTDISSQDQEYVIQQLISVLTSFPSSDEHAALESMRRKESRKV